MGRGADGSGATTAVVEIAALHRQRWCRTRHWATGLRDRATKTYLFGGTRHLELSTCTECSRRAAGPGMRTDLLTISWVEHYENIVPPLMSTLAPLMKLDSADAR